MPMTTVAPDNFVDVRSAPRRRRRWWLRIPIIFITLIALIVVLTQIFLWTDYPRRIAEAQVERVLRVRTSIRSVSIGWLGHTRIEGVALTLPFGDDPFLKVDRIEATHASLPLIAFTQDLRDVRISGVELLARQSADGRWNLEQLRQPSASTQPTTSTRRSSNPLADLPNVHATDVRASIIRSDGRRLDLPVFAAELVKKDSLTATLHATAGEVLVIDGELGQTAALPQLIQAKFRGVPDDIAAFFGIKPPTPLTATIEWNGRLTGEGVAGSLNVIDALVAETQARGRVEIDAGKAIEIRPADLSVVVPSPGPIDLRTSAGAVVYDGEIRLAAIKGQLNGGQFLVDGRFDPRTLASDVAAKWEAVTRGSDLATTGSAHLTTSRLFNGEIRIDVDARGGARVPAGEAMGAVRVGGELGSLDQFTGKVELDPLTWTPADRSSPIVTPRMTGDVSGAGNDVRLQAQSIDPGIGRLQLFGGVDRETLIWWANFDAGGLTLPELARRGLKGPVDISVAADGTRSLIHVAGAYAKIDRGIAYLTGDYDAQLPRPVNAKAWAWYEKPVTEDEAAQLNSLRAEATIEGTLKAPREINAELDLTGNELVFAGKPVGDVALRLTGAVSENEATIRSQELEAFGGKWSLRGRYSMTEPGPPVLTANFRDIPASRLGVAIGREDIEGTIQQGRAIIRVPSTRLDRIEMSAVARGADLKIGPARAGRLVVEAQLQQGRFEIRPQLREEDGSIDARLTGDVMLRQPVHAEVEITDWPAPYLVSTTEGGERFRPRASGRVRADLSPRTGEVNGEAALNGVVERGDLKLANFSVDAAIQNKLITFTAARIETLDGTLAASGSADLANFNATRLDASFQNLTPARLAWANPIIGEVGGKLDGTLTLHPSENPRALGPMELELKVEPSDMAFRNIAIGNLDLLAYAELKSSSEFRFVTAHTSLHVAGGVIEPFARLSSEPSRGMSQLVTAQFKDLDLGQIAKAIDDDGKEVVGKVAGRVQVFGQTTRLATLAGDASIDIYDSDLANFGPIAFLYDALSIGTAGSKPIGSGSIQLRFGGDVLTIDDATYFNRGVYANAFGPVRGISKGTSAEIDHVIVAGSLQPLRAVKLPFFGDINDTLSALGSSLTTVEVTGVAKDPQMRLVPLNALGETVGKVLLGKARGEK